MIRGDALHILYCKGVGSHLAGSLLHYMAFYDWPNRQKVSASKRIQVNFAKVRDIYSTD